MKLDFKRSKGLLIPIVILVFIFQIKNVDSACIPTASIKIRSNDIIISFQNCDESTKYVRLEVLYQKEWYSELYYGTRNSGLSFTKNDFPIQEECEIIRITCFIINESDEEEVFFQEEYSENDLFQSNSNNNNNNDNFLDFLYVFRFLPIALLVFYNLIYFFKNYTIRLMMRNKKIQDFAVKYKKQEELNKLKKKISNFQIDFNLDQRIDENDKHY